MASALDYMDWRGDLSFSASPANEVDYLLLAQLSTPDYTGIIEDVPVSVKDASLRYNEQHNDKRGGLGVLQSTGVPPMLKKMENCPRFQDVMLSSYINKYSDDDIEQFSAVTALLPDGTMCVSFRGTDDTIIGYKEDFHFAIMDTVPAQQDAVDYLERVASGFCGDIITCGHSKGGNLAVYAAVNASYSVRSRIKAVYSYDGPGFMEDFLCSPEYSELKDRIMTIVSQNSTVGTLLNLAGQRVIVKSIESGIAAHDGFTWEVLGTRFIREDELSSLSRAFKTAMDETLFGMSMEDRALFTNELFDTLLSTGAKTLTELSVMKPSAAVQLLKSLNDRKMVNDFISEMIENTVKALIPQIFSKDN